MLLESRDERELPYELAGAGPRIMILAGRVLCCPSPA